MKAILSIILFYFISGVLFAQTNKVDSLKKALNGHKEEDTSFAKTLFELGDALYGENSDSADKYVEEGLELANKLNWEAGKGKGFLLLSNIQLHAQTYDKAVISGLNALRSSEKINDSILIARCNSELGEIYRLWHNDSLAELHSKKFLTIAIQLKDKKFILSANAQLAQMYAEQEQWDKAEQFLNAGIKGASEQHNEVIQEQLLHLIALKQLLQDDFTAAIESYREALAILKRQKNYHGIAYTYVRISLAFSYLNNKDSAYYYGNAALEFSKKYQLSKELMNSYQVLTDVSIKFHDYRSAFLHHEVVDSLYYQVYNIETAQNIERARAKADQEKRDAITKAEQERQNANTKRIRNTQYTVIAFFLLLVIFLFWNNRQKQKSKIKIEKAYGELKATQAQLVQSEKMASLGELTAGIAHEIQNPLNFVNNFSEVNTELIDELVEEANKGNIQEITAIAKDLKENEQKINHHGKRADAIVKGMLQHSRSSTGVKESTDINKLADEYLRLAYHGLRAKDKSFNATLKTDYDENIENVNIIPQDIGRVLLNVINNAFYAITEKKKQPPEGYDSAVSISTKKLDGKVEIRVKDNGNGIPEKVIDKIFQPFFTTKPTGQGTGLGLSLAYDIINAHGGEIKVSTKKGEFTEFMIWLPILT